MIKKAVYPDSFDYGVPAVELIGHYSKGLDKTAMDKRASAFTKDDMDFPRKKGYRYLHIITTCLWGQLFCGWHKGNHCMWSGTNREY